MTPADQRGPLSRLKQFLEVNIVLSGAAWLKCLLMVFCDFIISLSLSLSLSPSPQDCISSGRISAPKGCLDNRFWQTRSQGIAVA